MSNNTLNYHSKKTAEYIALGCFLFLSSFLVFVQRGRVLPLVDFSYQIEAGYRLYRGQVPYRDFLLVLPPGTYSVIALIMKVFGLKISFQGYYVMGLQAMTILISFLAVKSLLKKNGNLSLWLCSPLIFAQFVIYPFHSYDINTGFAMICCILCYSLLERKQTYLRCFLFGVILTLPSFFKQNTGLVFLICFLFAIAANFYFSKKHTLFFAVILGVAAAYSSFLFWLIREDALKSFVELAFIYSNKTRPVWVSLGRIGMDIVSYQTLIFMYPFLFWLRLYHDRSLSRDVKLQGMSLAILTAFVVNPLIIAPIAFILKFDAVAVGYILSKYYFKAWYLLIGLNVVIPLCYFKKLRDQKALDHWTLLGIVPSMTALASFLSQTVNNSNYGIWPLFVLMMALPARLLCSLGVPEDFYRRQIKIVSVTITILLCIYSMTLRRLKFVSLEGALGKASHENLKGLATPGDWLKEMEDMIHKTEELIPRTDKVATLPGEDPYYFLTGREPAISYISYNWITCNLSSKAMIDEYLAKNIKWVIVKTKLQDADGFKPMDKVMQYLQVHYEKKKAIPAYDIYKRK